MNVNTATPRQTLNYVFNAAANAPATAVSQGASLATGVPQLSSAPPSPPSVATSKSATAPPPVPYADGSYPAGSISAEEARRNLLDFLNSPDTVRLKMMRLDPSKITYGPPSQQAAPTPRYVPPPEDPKIPIHVGVDGGGRHVGIGVGDPVISFMMFRSIVHSREIAGQPLNVLEGSNNTPVDAHEYLETLRQAAIAAVEAQAPIDKDA
jgi:hypothetical protein